MRKFYRINEKKKIMNKNVGIAAAVGIAIIIGVIGFQIYDSSYQRTTTEEYYKSGGIAKNVVYPENPQTLYGLTITKDKYLLGENVFMKVSGIPMGLKDNLLVFSPGGKKYLSIEFDGDEKDYLKYYFRPSLLRHFDMCDKSDIIGKWTIIFEGIPNEKLHFQVMEETLPGSEEYYVNCNEALEAPFQIRPDGTMTMP